LASGAEKRERGHGFSPLPFYSFFCRISALYLLANLGAALAVNRWYKFFFDALEQKDTKAVVLGLGLVLALPVFSVAFSVGLPGVVIEATHQCMTTRGVHKSGVTMVISRCWVRFGQERKLGTSFSPLSI